MCQKEQTVRGEPIKPTRAQLDWQDAQVGAFFHFGPNTFHAREWSDGTLPAASFDPSDLDTREWVRIAAEMGARYAVITAKHHDGFCLWPTSTTDYSVRSSPWRDGEGDVVGEFASACSEFGLGLGIYLSPWDRNQPLYEDCEAYSDFYCEQLTELCTLYGPVTELWFDGAGSDGYEYRWDKIMQVARQHQPDAMIFNMGEPSIRWVGNEDGLAQDPVEYVAESTSTSNYTDAETVFANFAYLPPECDVSLRRNWFWREDDEPKTLEHMLAIYYNSVGLGANLLVNIPPDRRGRVDADDVAAVRELGAEIRRRFGGSRKVHLDRTGPSAWEGAVPGPFDHIVLREDLVDGQRVTAHRVLLDGEPIAEGKTVGSQRIHATGEFPAGMIRVELDGECPNLRDLSVTLAGVAKPPAFPLDYSAPTEAPDERAAQLN